MRKLKSSIESDKRKDAVNDFINMIDKHPAPKKIDWDKTYYSEIEERMK